MLEIARAGAQIALGLRERHQPLLGEQTLEQCIELFWRHQLFQVRQYFYALHRSQVGLEALAVRLGKPIPERPPAIERQTVIHKLEAAQVVVSLERRDARMERSVDKLQAVSFYDLQLRHLTGRGGNPSAQAHDCRIECGNFQLRQIGKNA
ncbi:hypothetical protein D3C81_1440310 [compost metagenome]